MKQMRILFLRPSPPEETIGLQHVMIVEPLELEILATLVEKEHKVKIIDLILEKKAAEYFIKEFNPDIVCVTGYITHINKIIDICKKAKELDPLVKTVVGGVYIEKMPENIDHPAVDFRVIRNAVDVFPKLINAIETNTDIPDGVLKKGQKVKDDELPVYTFNFPIPNRLTTKKYRKQYFYVFHNRVALLKTSFGCPFPCTFCFCRKITGENYVERPLPEVIEELKDIREKEIYIIDDNFLVSEKRVSSFLKLLQENNIKKKYLIYGRADFIATHPDLMRKFKEQGLRTVIVGFESFNDTELMSFHKKTTAHINEAAMEVLNKNKIDCYASVIVMPEWDKDDFKRAIQKMIQLGIRFLNIQPLAPLEKTDIDFDDKNLIIPRTEFEKWDLAHVVISPTKMSLQDYYHQILHMYERVLFRPGNLMHHLKYSPAMQFRLLWGAAKVRSQYIKKIKCLK